MEFIRKYQAEVVQDLDYWGIVAFYGGKIDGAGYGGAYHETEDPWSEINGNGLSGSIIIAEAKYFEEVEEPVDPVVEEDHCMCRSTVFHWYCEEDNYFDSHVQDECDSSFCYWGFKNGTECPAHSHDDHDHVNGVDDEFGERTFELKPADYVWI